jgi:hypothetical protein
MIIALGEGTRRNPSLFRDKSVSDVESRPLTEPTIDDEIAPVPLAKFAMRQCDTVAGVVAETLIGRLAAYFCILIFISTT